MDRQLVLQFRDPPSGGDQLNLVAGRDTRQLAGIDQLLRRQL
jgi:hypothetical protein